VLVVNRTYLIQGKPSTPWCGRIYDLAKVEVNARCTDCSKWTAPRCGRTVDNRGEPGTTTHITVIDQRELPNHDHREQSDEI
jgi:hypothetical protein